jgi:hypothetical protein
MAGRGRSEESFVLPEDGWRPEHARTGGEKPVRQPQNKIIMKKFLVLIAIVSLTAGGAFASCGKKVTSEGTLKSYDAEKKQLVVEDKEGKATTITLTPSTTGADAITSLIGKSVKVVAEHGKADSVAAGS